MGYVYLILDTLNNTYKIGVTRNKNNQRLKLLLVGNSSKLELIDTVECKYPFRLETMLHNKYKSKRLEGEWFELSESDVKNFKLTCKDSIKLINVLLDNPFFNKNLK